MDVKVSVVGGTAGGMIGEAYACQVGGIVVIGHQFKDGKCTVWKTRIINKKIYR